MQTREQAAELVAALLTSFYHPMAQKLVEAKFGEMLAEIFATEPFYMISVDLVLPLLTAVEQLGQNEDYRKHLAESPAMAANLALLLRVNL